jgi:hypothetical protein
MSDTKEIEIYPFFTLFADRGAVGICMSCRDRDAILVWGTDNIRPSKF